MTKKLAFVIFPLLLFSSLSRADVTNQEMDCLFSWAETTYPQLLSPLPAPSLTLGKYYYRYYSVTDNYLGVDTETQRGVFLSAGTLLDLGDVAPLVAFLACSGSSTLPQTTSYAGTWTWSGGDYYSIQVVLTQDGNRLTAQIPSVDQHFSGELKGTTAVFTEDDGKATAQATVTLVSANAADLRMDSCTPALMCLMPAGMVIRLTR